MKDKDSYIGEKYGHMKNKYCCFWDKYQVCISKMDNYSPNRQTRDK